MQGFMLLMCYVYFMFITCTSGHFGLIVMITKNTRGQIIKRCFFPTHKLIFLKEEGVKISLRGAFIKKKKGYKW